MHGRIPLLKHIDINDFGWTFFDHPPLCPDLAPSDFHLFPNIKICLRSERFNDDDKLKAAVNNWLIAQAAELYSMGIEKLVPRYDKCLNVNGKYVDK